MPTAPRDRLFDQLEPRCLLSTYIVDNSGDASDGNFGSGQFTLREAIERANAHDGADEIIFASSLGSAEIHQTSNSEPITDDLAIRAVTEEGDPITVTLWGEGHRGFLIDDGNDASSIEVSLEGIAVYNTHAGDGAAINSTENLTLRQVLLSNNSATSQGGGIYQHGSTGSLSIFDSAIRDNSANFGGGIVVDGTPTVTIEGTEISGNTAQGRAGMLVYGDTVNLTIHDTKISGNTATSSDGGGLAMYDGGTLVITGSSISGNSSGDYSGGLALYRLSSTLIDGSSITENHSDESGGGLRVLDAAGPTIIRNCTISSNSAPGATAVLFDSPGRDLDLRNCTIAYNSSDSGSGPGIGIYNGVGYLISNIVANNTGSGGAPHDILLTHGSINTSGSTNNLIGSDESGGLTNGVNGNMVGVDPKLDATENWGHLNYVNRLQADSPAIDAGLNPDGLTTDGRSLSYFARESGGGVDIGAYERQTASFTVTTADDRDDGYSPGRVGLSLREALALANGNPGADSIGFEQALAGSTLTLDRGELSISESVMITGLGADQLTVDAGGNSRIFHADGAGDAVALVLSGLTLTGGNASGPGGGVYLTSGSLSLTDITLSGNTATDGGGAYLFAGDLSLTDCTVTGNTASSNGGGIATDYDATVTITGTDISSNTAGRGGGLYTSGELELRDSTVTDNTAGGEGGGIDTAGPHGIVISGATISGNSSGAFGGGLTIYGSMMVEISDSTFRDNTAEEGGGGISIINNEGATISIAGSTFDANTAQSDGGGLAVRAAVSLTITGSTFSDNTTSASGAGIYFYQGNDLTISDSTISGNSAGGSGGGLLAGGSGSHRIDRTTIADNSSSRGGGIRFGADGGGSTLDLTNSTISGNTSSTFGGGLDADHGTATMTNCTISGNTAAQLGGGVSLVGEPAELTIANSTIAYNSVASESGFGGGIYDETNPITLTSTILANNTNSASGAPDDIKTAGSGSVASDSAFNLIGDADTSGGLTDGENHNLVGVDPQLSPLADNGGPTPTHALMAGSPAIDKGAAFSGLQTDQRGGAFERFYGEQPDIGAFEWAPFSLRVLAGGEVTSTSLADGTLLSVARTDEHRLVVLEGAGTEWTALRLSDHTDAPLASGDPIIWTDPNDGLAYIGVPYAGGFLLYRRGPGGTWTYRDLGEETSSGADAPVGTLAYFITRPKVGKAFVYVAGINSAGEIVAYQQTSAAGSTEASWKLSNISDDLASQDMSTPAFTKISAYVTSWNQWTLAGLDADGNVQGVWVNVATFTTWRVDNLSAITGADPLAGELDVTLTPWGGIRFAGSNDAGHLVGTWWNPGRGPGNWTQTDMTNQVTANAPTLDPGELTAWFLGVNNMISYAGYDASGDIISLFWQPGDGACGRRQPHRRV
ncbi:MAG: right-handed parallel beta-helix repeat-containing protein [Phycisphaerales bacterium]|nr:right-handed parallel beta-helix repeat-containing protein [Phycisphaerales bacterium]